MSKDMETAPPTVSLGRIILYVHDIEKVADFYVRHFGFTVSREDGDRIVELESADPGGSNILLHPMGKGRKAGQTLAKLVFDCQDVRAFCAQAEKNGLQFGPFQKGAGYEFANTKDPAGNSVSVSSRIYRFGIYRQDE